MRQLYVIDAESVEELTGWPRIVRVDSRGNAYFVNTQTRLAVKYDPNRRSTTVIGRSGAGPGEFRVVLHILLDDDDNVSIIDGELMRRTVLRSNGTAVGYTNLWAGAVGIRDAVPLTRERLAVVAPSRDQAHVGLPIKVIDGNGGLVQALGAAPGPVLAQDALAQGRRIGKRSEGGFWMVRDGDYVIESFDDELRRQLSVRIDGSGFRPPPMEPGGVRRLVARDRVPTGCAMRGLWEVGGGSLAVAYICAKANAPAASPSNRFQLFQTMIDLVDVSSGTVLQQATVDGEMLCVARSGVIATYAERDGIPIVALWRVEFRQ